MNFNVLVAFPTVVVEIEVGDRVDTVKERCLRRLAATGVLNGLSVKKKFSIASDRCIALLCITSVCLI